MDLERAPSSLAKFGRGVAVATGAVGLALGCFLVLPLLQAISATPPADLTLRSVDSAALPPPPPPVEEEPEQEKQEEQKPPELADEAPPLDLAQLELALNPGLGAMDGAGDFAIKIQGLTGSGDGKVDDLFSLADLDQKPRPIFQQQPLLSAAMRKKLPATVYVVFAVDPSGRVEEPLVQSSTNTLFDPAALAAIKQWKFEPGKRGGQAVRSRMRQQFTFQ